MAGAADKLWEVVGGEQGLVVRAGKDVVSAKEAQKLAKGAVVREKELVKDRLCYELVAGSGPPTGWVSIKSAATGKPVLVRTSAAPSEAPEPKGSQQPEPQAPAPAVAAPAAKAAAEPAAGADPAQHSEPAAASDAAVPAAPRSAGQPLEVRADIPPVTDRRMRVLGLHGAPGNGNLTKYQTTQMRKVLGGEVEWLFLDAPRPWTPEVRGKMDKWQHVTRERTDMEQRIADGSPFTQWYEIDLSGEVDEPPNKYVQEGAEYILEYIEKEGPIDVVVAFSNGASTLFALLLMLHRHGLKAPWRLNVFFCGSPPPQEAGECAPIDQPTVEVLGGDGDNWAPLAKYFSTRWCTNLLVIEHEDGHQFPATDPRATEIYAWLAAEMRRHCGLAAPGDELLRRPPVPQQVDVTVRHALPDVESEIVVTVMDNCKVSDVRKAVMDLLGETKLSEVRLVRRQGLSFTALEGEEPIGDRREFLSIGRSLAVPATAEGAPEEAAPASDAPRPRQQAAAAPAAPPAPPGKRLWRVVGGAQTGGIRVKERVEFNSVELPKKLATGSLVEELDRGGEEDERVRYLLIMGEGPKVGWVSQWIKDKQLLEPFVE